MINAVADLFGEDSWRRVYAGELDVRPPSGPDRAAPPVTVRDQSFFIASSASGLLAIESTDVEIDLVAPTVVAVNPPTVDSI
jgi:hypothetical protein